MEIRLEPSDLKELLELTRSARRTPVIAMSLKDGLEGRDFAAHAWDRVRAKWYELGKKYNFDPTCVRGIKADTGIVLT